MTGLGTIVNAAAILCGSGLGLLIKKGVKERFQDILIKSLGLCTIFIGASGALTGLLKADGEILTTTGTILMIFSIVLGALIGELLRIEDRLEHLGDKLKRLVHGKGSFTEGFVTSSLVFCVGAMSIVGSLQDGLTGDTTTLFAKSILDGVIAIVFASTLGVGVVFSIIPIIVYQGGITLAAMSLAPLLKNPVLIQNMSYIGSVLIFAIGINLAFGKKFKVGNMLPAILIPVIYGLIF